MARNEQLIRQHKLLQILERYRFGRTLAELRDELVDELGLGSLHTRSVRRDLEALQAAGFDVGVHDAARGRVWKLGPLFRGSHPITASATELIALSLGRELLTPLAGTPFWVGIESFWNKIRESLPEAVWNHYQKYRQVLHVLGVPAKSYEKQQGILKTLNRAILEHRVVLANYQPLGQDRPTPRRLRPYGIVFYQGSLYVVAQAEGTGAPPAIRHLKLDRFRAAEALDEWFKPAADFDLDEHLRQGLGIFGGPKRQTARIRVSDYAARWIAEDPWHPDQELSQDERGTWTLSVPVTHPMEVIPRVLALGDQAELLSPAACRQQLTQIVRKLADQYDKTDTSG